MDVMVINFPPPPFHISGEEKASLEKGEEEEEAMRAVANVMGIHRAALSNG